MKWVLALCVVLFFAAPATAQAPSLSRRVNALERKVASLQQRPKQVEVKNTTPVAPGALVTLNVGCPSAYHRVVTGGYFTDPYGKLRVWQSSPVSGNQGWIVGVTNEGATPAALLVTAYCQR